MSMEEKPRQRKEVKKEKTEDHDSINDWLDNAEIEKEEVSDKPVISSPTKEEITAEPQEVVEPPKNETVETTSETITEAPIDIFIIKLPPWVKKPWMYVQPTHEQQLGSWLDSWKGLVLEYSRSYNIHVVNLSQLNTTYPFKNQEIGKTLTYGQLQTIIDIMVNEGLARWIDETKISARIYYLTNKEWANKIMSYMVDSGYAAEIMTFYELQQLKQQWSTLPRDELRDVFEILVTDGRAKWVGESKDTLSFIL